MFTFFMPQDAPYSQNQVSYANGDHGAMALNGFPGHGTTQYTSVHHHRISHNDGDEDLADEPAAGGYGAGNLNAGYGNVGYGAGPAGYAPGMFLHFYKLKLGLNCYVWYFFTELSHSLIDSIGPVPFVPRFGSFGGYHGGIIGGHNAYHPRHVHVGVGTPGVKVEVETAKRNDVAAQV